MRRMARSRQRLCQQGLPNAGNVLDENMPFSEQAGQCKAYNRVFAVHVLLNIRDNSFKVVAEPCDLMSLERTLGSYGSGGRRVRISKACVLTHWPHPTCDGARCPSVA